jgi:hypothetical protein
MCGELSGDLSQPGALQLDVNAAKRSITRINLKIDDISSPLADNISDVLTDLLEIASYVYCADQFTSRGSTLMAHMGAEWRRNFRFKIPVRQLSVWQNPEIRDALQQTLGFLSEDEFVFEFVEAAKPASLQAYLGFADSEAQVIHPDEIILFSGGLDSLAGAVEAIAAHKRVVLVSHKASNMIASKQQALVAELRKGSRAGDLFHVPVTVNSGKREAVEFTQRTRSFLFAALGLIVARLFDRNGLTFYENGVVSINLPIAEHVLGTRASRTTHPRVFADCSRLFSLLLNRPFALENPYLWKTKTEIVETLADHNASSLIQGTLSCANIRDYTKNNKHCGVCSQCVDRRFGILAAGLGDQEPSDHYSVELFRSERQPGPSLSMAESYVGRAFKLANMSEQTFFATYGQVFRAISYLPGDPNINARKLWELHRRHGREVVTVIDHELKRAASLSDTLSRPRGSLLSLIASASVGESVYSDPIETEPKAKDQAFSDTHDYAPQRIQFAIAKNAKKVMFKDIQIGGATFALMAELAAEFEADLGAGTFREQYQFVKAPKLAKRLRITESSLRRRVSRARQQFERAFKRQYRRTLHIDDIIQNQEWSGYRLNPYLLLVLPAQLRDESHPASQLVPEDVTTSLGAH